MAPSATESPSADVEMFRARKTPLYLNVYHHQSLIGKPMEKHASPQQKNENSSARTMKQSSRLMDRKLAAQHSDARSTKAPFARASVAGALKSRNTADSEKSSVLGKRPHHKVADPSDKMEPASRAPRVCGPATSPTNKTKDHDKYCHFCQHVKVSMLACETQFCSHRFCTYCLTVHLGDDVDPTSSGAWRNGQWSCPTCRSDCCCSSGDCTRNHRHCKAFRYRCRRANAATLRTTAAHALVSLGSNPSAKPTKGARAVVAGGVGGAAKMAAQQECKAPVGGVSPRGTRPAAAEGEEEEAEVMVKSEDGREGEEHDVMEEAVLERPEDDRMEGLVIAAMDSNQQERRLEEEEAEERAAVSIKEEEELPEPRKPQEELDPSKTTGEEELALKVLLGLSEVLESREACGPIKARDWGTCGADIAEEAKPELLSCPSHESSAPSTPPRGGGEEEIVA
mmetsp:Transcript_63135/g.148707  ORF Transcript_63135/g.148707 Transcript_63135/m.148707 type:complete len:454 (-) Transcript_63135:145-1506(-)